MSSKTSGIPHRGRMMTTDHAGVAEAFPPPGAPTQSPVPGWNHRPAPWSCRCDRRSSSTWASTIDRAVEGDAGLGGGEASRAAEPRRRDVTMQPDWTGSSGANPPSPRWISTDGRDGCQQLLCLQSSAEYLTLPKPKTARLAGSFRPRRMAARACRRSPGRLDPHPPWLT